MSRARVTLSRLEKAGRAGEDAVLVITLTAMILLAASQIVMRNFFSFGFIWTDEMLRMLVLWIAVAGAVAASRNDKHINIAILDRFLPDRIKLAVKIVVHLFTAAVCGVAPSYEYQPSSETSPSPSMVNSTSEAGTFFWVHKPFSV